MNYRNPRKFSKEVKNKNIEHDIYKKTKYVGQNSNVIIKNDKKEQMNFRYPKIEIIIDNYSRMIIGWRIE